MRNEGPTMIQIGNVIVSMDCLTEKFCCDLAQCKGCCCVEGDAGAPVTLDEIKAMQDALPLVEPLLSTDAKAVIRRSGVSYRDRDGDDVTSIVNGRDCVFTYYRDDCCSCAFEHCYRDKLTGFKKPVSCELYPIREKQLRGGLVALNYHRWDVCKAAVRKGERENIPLYVFLRSPLIRRFGEAWYAELEQGVDMLVQEGYLSSPARPR